MSAKYVYICNCNVWRSNFGTEVFHNQVYSVLHPRAHLCPRHHGERASEGLEQQLSKWRPHIPQGFDYDFIDPDFIHKHWNHTYKPCSYSRLFLHEEIPDVKWLVHMDMDVLALTSIRSLWDVGYSTECQHDVTSHGGNTSNFVFSEYKKRVAVLFLPPTGLNSFSYIH